eukprot:m.61641 g.61641  ORF g.61641 m.61641 type:complete len:440 (-) comp13896_c1_seq1:104-1423(-)
MLRMLLPPSRASLIHWLQSTLTASDNVLAHPRVVAVLEALQQWPESSTRDPVFHLLAQAVDSVPVLQAILADVPTGMRMKQHVLDDIAQRYLALLAALPLAQQRPHLPALAGFLQQRQQKNMVLSPGASQDVITYLCQHQQLVPALLQYRRLRKRSLASPATMASLLVCATAKRPSGAETPSYTTRRLQLLKMLSLDVTKLEASHESFQAQVHQALLTVVTKQDDAGTLLVVLGRLQPLLSGEEAAMTTAAALDHLKQCTLQPRVMLPLRKILPTLVLSEAHRHTLQTALNSAFGQWRDFAAIVACRDATALLNNVTVDDALFHTTLCLANNLSHRWKHVLLPVPRLLASNPRTAEPSALTARQARTLHPGWVTRSTRWVLGGTTSTSQMISRVPDGFAVQPVTLVGDTLEPTVFGSLMDAVMGATCSPVARGLFDQVR